MLLMITMSIVKETECKGGIRGRAEVIYSLFINGATTHCLIISLSQVG